MRKAIDWNSVKTRLAAALSALDSAQAVNPERMSAVFRARAERLARSRSTLDKQADGLNVLTFTLGENNYALELNEIAEVLPLGRFTPVPSAPHGLAGVFNLRGEIVSIIDLAALLKVAPPAAQPGGYVLVLRRPELAVALKIDRVSQIKRYAPDELFQKMETSGGETESGVKVVGLDGTQILNMETVLDHAVFKID